MIINIIPSSKCGEFEGKHVRGLQYHQVILTNISYHIRKT